MTAAAAVVLTPSLRANLNQARPCPSCGKDPLLLLLACHSEIHAQHRLGCRELVRLSLVPGGEPA